MPQIHPNRKRLLKDEQLMKIVTKNLNILLCILFHLAYCSYHSGGCTPYARPSSL